MNNIIKVDFKNKKKTSVTVEENTNKIINNYNIPKVETRALSDIIKEANKRVLELTKRK